MIVTTPEQGLLEELVLVLTLPGDSDAAEQLRAAGISTAPCGDIDELCRRIREGGGAMVVADECLAPDQLEHLAGVLSGQPRWSDMPLIVLAPGGPDANWRALEPLVPAGAATILERPVPTATLVSTVQLALRARKRQYELRDRLTDWERHERSLRESKERYRQLVESSPDAILAASADGRIVYANRAVLSLLGADDLGSVIGAPLLEWLGPDCHDSVLRRLRRAARAARREEPLECSLTRPGGPPVTIELAISPLPWEGAAAVQVVLRDVSTRHEGEEHLRCLTALNDSFRDLESPTAIMEAAAETLLTQLGVARVVFADVDHDNQIITRAAARGEPPRNGASSADLGIIGDRAAALLAHGETLAIHDVRSDERTAQAARGLDEVGVRSGVCAPIIGHGRLVAVLAAYERQPRVWADAEVALVEEVGRRTWLAVERARALVQLRESESNLRALTESLPQIVWSARPEGSPEFYNQRWFEYTGLTPGSEDQFDSAGVLHEDDRAKTAAAWEHAVRTGEPYDLEHRVRRADGTYRWHISRAFPVRDEHGRITRWFGAATDIDDHKRLEQALRTSEEEYRTTFELAAVGKSHADPVTGRLLRVNRKLCEITGYAEHELLGMSFLDITHPEDRERNSEAYARLLRGEISELFVEKRYVRKEGTTIWVDVNTAIIRDADGRPIRCVAVIQDTTGRRRAEEALRRSEQHMRAVLDSLEVAVGVLTPEGVVLEVNRDTLEAVRMSTEDVVGRRLDDLPWFGYDEGARSRLRDGINAAAAGRSVRYDAVARVGDHEFILDLSIAPMFGPGGEVTHLVPSAIDITRRKHAEAELRDSERRHRELAEALPQLVWTSDASGDTDYVNAQYAAYAGVPIEQLAGRRWQDLLYPDDRDAVAAAWEAAVKGLAPYDVEHRLRRYDGAYRWFQTRGVPVRDAEGRIVKWFGTCTDIHERREAAEALRSSEERHRFVTRATNDAVWDLDIVTGRIEWGEALRTFGYRPEDVSDTIAWWGEQVHPEDRGRVEASLEEAIGSGAEHWSDEYRFRRADGSYAAVLDRGYAILDENGRTVRLIGAMQDVSDRKRAEESLRTSEARFRQLADAMPQIVWTATPEGRVDYCNRRWHEFTGAPPGEGGDDAWREVIHPDDALAYTLRWRDSVRTGRPFQHEYRLREQVTGTYRWHLGRAVPILDDRGRPVRWFGSSTNIDDQKLAQYHLSELVDELNRSNRELEDFAHIASHDLKEPLRGIRNYSSFLLEDYAHLIDKEGIRKLRTIDRLGKRMDDLISSLLYYSQVGRTEMAIEDTDLNQVVLEVLESLGPSLSERSVDVRLPRPLPTVRCDRVRVAEVYRNLIANAFKYTDKPDPWVEISWRPPPSTPDQEGAWPVLYVRDNGIGIPARHFGTVFGIFKRLHNRDDYGGGTGSGLAFVKRIIERHRGRVWIESTEGEGTTFCFTLGREEHAAAQTAHPHR